jgi:hypothetical protein
MEGTQGIELSFRMSQQDSNKAATWKMNFSLNIPAFSVQAFPVHKAPKTKDYFIPVRFLNSAFECAIN